MEEFKTDKILEDELTRFLRQYHEMNADRHMTSGCHPKLKRNLKTINVLHHDVEDLALDIKVSRSGAHAKNDIRVGNDLVYLLVEHENFQNEIMMERFQMNELDYMIKMAEKEVLHLESQQIATDQKFSDHATQSAQYLNQLENRLDTAMKRFNVVNMENQKLRTEIDHMLKERAHFNESWNGFISRLCKGRQYMEDILEQARLVYGQREEWCQKLDAIRVRGQMDFATHMEEMRILQQRLDNDRKLQNFLQIKGTKRILLEDNKRNALLEEERLANLERVAYLQTIVEGVKEESGINDIEKIIEQFQERDASNISLFKVLLDIFMEVKLQQNELDEYTNEIDKRSTDNEIENAAHDQGLNILKNDLEKQKQKTEDLQYQLDERQSTIDNALFGIAQIFTLLKCDNAPMQKLLCDKHLTEYNATNYFNAIESKLQQLIEDVYFVERRFEEATGVANKPDEDDVVMFPKVFVLKPNIVDELVNPCALCVESRELARVSDFLEETMTIDDTKKRLAKDRSDPNKPSSSERLHTLNDCKLPKSRRLLQLKLN